MQTDTLDAETLDVSIQNREGLERQMTVRVPMAQLERTMDARLKAKARKVRLKGFRPGKAPLAIVRRRFGDRVRDEVVSDVIRLSYIKAVRQIELQPAGDPRIDILSGADADQFSYRATFEVFPEIELAPLESLQVDIPDVQILESDVDDMLETIREQQARWDPVERKSAAGDRVVVDYTATVGKEPVNGGDGTEVKLVVGSEDGPADLDKALRGVRAGQRKSARVKFPQDHPVDGLAGQKAVLDIDVRRVEAKCIPEIDEDFLQVMGIEEGGVDALRTELRGKMEWELRQRLRSATREAAFDALLQANRIDVPAALVAREMVSMRQHAMRRLGTDDPDKAPPLSGFEAAARRGAGIGLLLEAMTVKHGIELDRDRMEARIAELAAPFEDPEGVARAWRRNDPFMASLQAKVLEDLVAEYIVEHGKTHRKTVGFRKFMA